MNNDKTPAQANYPGLPLTAGAKPDRPLRVCVASFDFVGPVKNGGVGTAFGESYAEMAKKVAEKVEAVQDAMAEMKQSEAAPAASGAAEAAAT